MESSHKNVERINKNKNSKIYEIYIYEEKIEIQDKPHYIKVDENVRLIHVIKLLHLEHLKDKLKIMFLSNDGEHGYDKIASEFLEIMTPHILNELYEDLYTTQNTIIFTI